MQEAEKVNIEEIISNIRDFLTGLDSVIFAYIFGSFATCDVFADIDIGIFLKGEYSETPLEAELGIENDMQRLVSYPIDTRVLNNAPPFFLFHVIREGILVKDTDPGLRSDFEGLVFKKINDLKGFRDEYLREIINAPI